MAKDIGFVSELGVSDVQRAVDFYVHVVGCRFVKLETDENGIPFWAEVAFSSSHLMFERTDILSAELPELSGDFGKPRSALVLRIEPISAAKTLHDRLIALSHMIDTGPTETDYGAYEFSFRDPDNYVVVVAGRD